MFNKFGFGDLVSKLVFVLIFDDVVEVVVGGIIKKLVDIFMILEDDIIFLKLLVDFGVDFFVVVEFCNMLFMKVGVDLLIFDIMQSLFIIVLVGVVVVRSSYVDIVILRG